MKKWKCLVCGQVFEGEFPPDICPVCGAGKDQFEEVKEEGISFISNKNERIIIIGASVAALESAKAIRARNKNAEIVMLAAESELPYNRPGLSAFLSGDINFYNLFLEHQNFYEKHNIKVMLNTKAVGVNADKKEVLLSTGKKEKYDKLIIACGASAAVPFNAVFNDKNVFSLRSIEDAKNINAALKDAKTAVIVGGGILGLEAAKALHKKGLKITIVEYAPYIMGIQLDKKASSILMKNMQKQGVDIKASMQVTNVEDGKVDIKDNDTLYADIVIVCAGVRPNISLVEGAGIETGKGIVIDNKAQTNIKDIYAAGDISERDGKVTALWSNAINSGQAAGINAVGDEAFIKNEVASTVFNGFDTNIFSAGDIREDENSQAVTSENEDNYKKIVIKEGIITGGMFLGDVSSGAELIKAIENQEGMEKAETILK